jgi:putative nucleotidyltransferase with HDIG domain
LKKRVLFVDDEPYVLNGLRRMLHGMRQEWDMEFVSSGQEALARLSSSPFDVLVTDIRMPGMDGTELLIEVMRLYPEIVRIVLSGQSDEETMLKTVGPAHQFLSKPCDAEILKSTVVRATALRGLLSSERLKTLVSGLASLPSLPALYEQILRALQSSKISVTEVGELIAQDVGMTAKILQLVNSSFFGLPRHVSSPVEAAVLLGSGTLHALVLSVGIFSQYARGGQDNSSLDSLRNHSLAVSRYARRIAEAEKQDNAFCDDCFLAGLLHDVGKLVLFGTFPEAYPEIAHWACLQDQPLVALEQEAFGGTHAEVGAYLLALWGFADSIVEATAYHHFPSNYGAQAFGLLTAVHVSDAFASVEEYHGAEGIDLEYLSSIGFLHRLDAWRDLSADGPKEEQPDARKSLVC